MIFLLTFEQRWAIARITYYVALKENLGLQLFIFVCFCYVTVTNLL